MGSRTPTAVLVTTAILGLGGPAAADLDLHKGIRAGAALSSLESEPTDRQAARMSSAPGLTAGCFVTVGLRSWLAVQPELSITSKGALFVAPDPNGGTLDEDLELWYLELPLLLRATFSLGSKVSAYVAAGPHVALLLEGVVHQKWDGTQRNVTAATQRWDAGLTGAAGVAFRAGGGQVLLEARLVLGGPNVSQEFDSGNRTAVLTVGYSWDD